MSEIPYHFKTNEFCKHCDHYEPIVAESGELIGDNCKKNKGPYFREALERGEKQCEFFEDPFDCEGEG